jgi:hypothetical protein
VDDVPFVRGFDTVNQLPDDRERVIEIQRTAQVLTLDILHDQTTSFKWEMLVWLSAAM